MWNKDAKKYLLVDLPSQCALKNQVEKLEKKIATGKERSTSSEEDSDPDRESLVGRMSKLDLRLSMRKEPQESENFIREIRDFQNRSEQVLGYVVAASGFRTKHVNWRRGSGHMVDMDWALIKHHERRGTNAVSIRKVLQYISKPY